VKGFLVSRKIFALSLALVCLLVAALSAQAATPQTHAADDALDYIRTLQNDDGGFPAFGTESSASATLDVILAFAAAGVDPNDVQKSGHSPLDYLETQAADYAAATPGQAAKLVDVLVVAGEDPHDFAGEDFVDIMQSNYDSGTHRYGEQTLDQALYILARRSLGLSVSDAVINVLEDDEQAPGCWEFMEGFGCDTNSTAIAVQALIAAGVDASDSSIENAIDYFAGSQGADGGFPYVAPGDSDANSTAVVLQALFAAGEDIDAGGPWEAVSGDTPMQALRAFQNLTTGAFTYFGEDNAYATYQAVPALLLQPLLLPPSEEATETPEPTETPLPMATATPGATPTVGPTAVVPPPIVPPLAGPAGQVMPITVASTGEGPGKDASALWGVGAMLAVSGGCLVVGVLARRRFHAKE
jgi:hypothetical protein